ncbi:MAG: glycosyltransferase [Flavobacteriales bacterium]|nr:glycosyltransferase [Flavobacteriales bacterium]
MRVLHVIPSLIKGGAERLALEIVRHLNKVPSVESKLIYFHDINDYAKEYSDVDTHLLDIFVIPSIFGRWQVRLSDWNKLLDEYKPDVIHSHLFEADLLSRYKIRSGIRYFSHCHDNMSQLRSLQTDCSLNKKRITDLFERNFMLKRYRACNNRFISVGSDTTLFFQANLSKDLINNIIEVPNAIDTQRFSELSASCPSNTNRISILNVGSFVSKKNQKLLLDVSYLLKRNKIDFEVRFAGEGVLLEELRSKSIEMGLDEHVVFLGNVDNIESEMWKSHLYVHTAIYEPFGLVILEAMASGLPVMVLCEKGSHDLIIDSQNGYLISKEDPKLFFERILNLRNDNQLWKTFSESGKKTAKKHDIRTYMSRIIELYES